MSREFRRSLECHTDHLAQELLSIDWNQKAAYAAWLSQTFHFVAHTSRLICRAASQFEQKDNRFHKMMTDHLKEEDGHDTIASDDLRAMGYSLNDWPEWSITRVFHEHLKYQIDQVSPFCIFGRIYLLEGMASEFGPKLLEKVEKSFGTDCTRFLKLHTIEDLGHHEQSIQLLNLMTPDQIQFVHQGLESSVAIYSHLVKEWQKPQNVTRFKAEAQVA